MNVIAQADAYKATVYRPESYRAPKYSGPRYPLFPSQATARKRSAKKANRMSVQARMVKRLFGEL